LQCSSHATNTQDIISYLKFIRHTALFAVAVVTIVSVCVGLSAGRIKATFQFNLHLLTEALDIVNDFVVNLHGGIGGSGYFLNHCLTRWRSRYACL
jgi:hypothetical protein